MGKSQKVRISCRGIGQWPMRPCGAQGWTVAAALRADINACAAAADAQTALAVAHRVVQSGRPIDPHIVTVTLNLVADALESDGSEGVPASAAAGKAASVLLAKQLPGADDIIEACSSDSRLQALCPARHLMRSLRRQGIPADGDEAAMASIVAIPIPEGEEDPPISEPLPPCSFESARKLFDSCEPYFKEGQRWEGALSMYIRICSRSGRPFTGWAALGFARRAGIKPKLRSYTALLEALAPAQDAESCRKLHCEIKGCGLTCGQHEYSLLLQAYAPPAMRNAAAAAQIVDRPEVEPTPIHGEREEASMEPASPFPPDMVSRSPARGWEGSASEDAPPRQPSQGEGPPLASASTERWSSSSVLALLAELMSDVYAPGDALLEQIRRVFSSSPMRRRKWRVEQTVIAENGMCAANARKLRSLDLSDEELLLLARQTEELAMRSPRQQRCFEAFQRFLLANGPWDVVIDGANVGFFNQNYAGGRFSHSQIDDVVSHFEEEGRRPLLVLHERWFDPSADLQVHKRPEYKRRNRPQGGGQPPAKRLKGASDSDAGGHSAAADDDGSPWGEENSVTSDSGDEFDNLRLAQAESTMRKCIARWTASPSLTFRVPKGNNDDWYWLYAAVTRGGSPHLVKGSMTAMHRLVRPPSGLSGDDAPLPMAATRALQLGKASSASSFSTVPPKGGAMMFDAGREGEASRDSPNSSSLARRLSKQSSPGRPASQTSLPPPAGEPLRFGPASDSMGPRFQMPTTRSRAAARPASPSAPNSERAPASDSSSLPSVPPKAVSTAAQLAESEADVDGEVAAYMSDVSTLDATRMMRPPPSSSRGAHAFVVTSSPGFVGGPSSSSQVLAISSGSTHGRPPSSGSVDLHPSRNPPEVSVPVRRKRSDSVSRSSRMSAGSVSPVSHASSDLDRLPIGPGPSGSSTHMARHGRVFVISNDQMRDHHFQMLAPQNFLKWRERHQVTFHFQEMGRGPHAQHHLHFRFPAIYSHRTQPSLDGKAWFFPVAGSANKWLVVWKD
jgi:hypothetical protein